MTCFCTNVSSRHIWLAPFAFFYFGFFFRQGSGSWLLYSSKLLIQTRDGVMKLVPFFFSLNDTHLSGRWFVMLCYWHFPYQPWLNSLCHQNLGLGLWNYADVKPRFEKLWYWSPCQSLIGLVCIRYRLAYRHTICTGILTRYHPGIVKFRT